MCSKSADCRVKTWGCRTEAFRKNPPTTPELNRAARLEKPASPKTAAAANPANPSEARV